MRNQDWEILCTLHEHKSLVRTSEILFISQPALTRRLKQIEDEMGTTITQRTPKGMVFTPQGEILVQYAQNMLRSFNSIKAAIKTKDKVAGTLHIASSNSMTRFFLPDLLQQFMQKYPNINCEVTNALSHENIHLLNTRGAQVVLFCGDYSGAFTKKLLFMNQGYIVSSKPFSLEDLPNLPYISYKTDRFTGDIIEHWWYEWFDCPPYTAITVRSGDVAYEMVKRGLGYALFLNTSFWAFNKDLYYIKIYFKNGQPMERPSWLGYREESLEMENISAFVSHTKDYSAEYQKKMPELGDTNF